MALVCRDSPGLTRGKNDYFFVIIVYIQLNIKYIILVYPLKPDLNHRISIFIESLILYTLFLEEQYLKII